MLLPDVTQISEPPITEEAGIFVRPEPSPETLIVVKTPTFAVPCTSRLYPGVFVPIPTFDVWVSTYKLAIPTSRLEDVYTFPSTWRLASTGFAPIPTLPKL